MSRLKSLLMYAGLLGSLLGFSVTGSFAQTAPEGTSASLLRGPEQRVALVIGNAHYKNAPYPFCLTSARRTLRNVSESNGTTACAPPLGALISAATSFC